MRSRPLLAELVDAFCCLPGVGKKSAQRMAFHLLEKNREGALLLSSILNQSMNQIVNCQRCRNYTEAEQCQLCLNNKRDDSILCVVESPSDVAAIEGTENFDGKYFVLHGQLSPLDGIGPSEIGLPLLASRLKEGGIREIIMATASTVEGEATAHYIAQMVQQQGLDVKVSRLAQGVPVGGELGYIDQSTLTLSIDNRQIMG